MDDPRVMDLVPVLLREGYFDTEPEATRVATRLVEEIDRMAAENEDERANLIGEQCPEGPPE